MKGISINLLKVGDVVANLGLVMAIDEYSNCYRVKFSSVNLYVMTWVDFRKSAILVISKNG